jgi:hypothetical protein
MWRRLTGVLLLSVCCVVMAAAVSLAVTPKSLGARTVSTPRCTTAGLSVLQNLSAGTVISVTVGGLPAACGGATLQLTVNNGVANSSGSATVPGSGGSVTVTLGTPVAVTSAEQTDLVLVGP